MLNLTDAEIKEVGANRFYKSNIVAIIILFVVLTLSVIVTMNSVNSGDKTKLYRMTNSENNAISVLQQSDSIIINGIQYDIIQPEKQNHGIIYWGSVLILVVCYAGLIYYFFNAKKAGEKFLKEETSE
jgi:magnesium-transporting ATPase (P-type)